MNERDDFAVGQDGMNDGDGVNDRGDARGLDGMDDQSNIGDLNRRGDQGDVSDQAFAAALAAVERGEPLPDGLSADDAADLAVAARLFAQRAAPAESLVRRAFSDPPMAGPEREESAERRGSLVGRFGFARAGRWLPEAAVLLLVIGLGAVVATQFPRIVGGPDQARPSNESHEISGPAAGTATLPAGATPAPAYPPPAGTRTGAYRLTGQVMLDRWRGHIRARGTVDGQAALMIITTEDGALHASSAVVAEVRDGKFALSDQWAAFDLGDHLVVAGGPERRSDETISAIPTPSGPLDAVPAPLADTVKDQILVFRDNRVLFVDPDVGQVVRTLDTDVRRENFGQAGDGGPLPIENAILDPDRRILYLDFTTYSSTPWGYHQLVAHDLESGRELFRAEGSSAYAALAADGALYVASWNRMGVSHVSKWQEDRPEIFSNNWGGFPIGVAHDPGRERVYVATETQLRTFDAGTMGLLAVTPLPFRLDSSPEHPSSLVGYDPETDRLFFVADGRLEHMQAEDLEMPAAAAPIDETPPSTAVRELHFSPRWPEDKTLYGVWDSGVLAPACDAFGQTGGRLLVSKDAGRSWKRAAGNLRPICDQVSALAVLPATAADRPPVLVAGVPGLGIFRSEDDGAWWHPSGLGLEDAGVARLRLAPGGDGTLFAASYLGELHSSPAADQGRIWSMQALRLPVFDISPDFASDGTLMGAVYVEPSGGQIKVSHDRGASWQGVGPVPDWPDDIPGDAGVEMLSLAPLFAKWGVAFLYHSDGALYRSADGGQTWAKVLEGLGHATATPRIVYGPDEENRPVYLITATSDDPARDPATGRLRYFRSGDGGQTWEEGAVNAGVEAAGAPSALAPAPDFATSGRLFVGTLDGGVVEQVLAVR